MGAPLSGTPLLVSILMGVMALALAGAAGAIARRRFLSGARGLGWVMIVGVLAGVLAAVLWGASIAKGVGPFFMPGGQAGEVRDVCPSDPPPGSWLSC